MLYLPCVLLDICDLLPTCCLKMNASFGTRFKDEEDKPVLHLSRHLSQFNDFQFLKNHLLKVCTEHIFLFLLFPLLCPNVFGVFFWVDLPFPLSEEAIFSCITIFQKWSKHTCLYVYVNTHIFLKKSKQYSEKAQPV